MAIRSMMHQRPRVRSSTQAWRRRTGLTLMAVASVSLLLVNLVAPADNTAFLPGPSAAGGLRPSVPVRMVDAAPVAAAHFAEVLPSGTPSTETGLAAEQKSFSRTRSLLGSSMSSLGVAPLAAAAAYAACSRSSSNKLARNSGSGSTTQDSGSAIGGLSIIAGWVVLMYAIQHSIIGIPGISEANVLYFPIVATFIAGYGVIVLEEQLEINKAATALVLGVLVWVFIGTGLNLSGSEFETYIKETLVDVSEVVFFLLGALTIVEIMDAHKGFDIITRQITQTKARDLLVVVGVLTFVLSSVLNNLTVVIVMISLLQKVVKDEELRLKIGGVVVVLSNAGGAWTPIGDITTTMMYIGGQVTTVPLLVNLVVPSVLCLVGTLGFEFIQMDGEKEFTRPAAKSGDNETPNGQSLVFFGGLFGMVSVPVFTALTQCPAWSGMMLVLGLLGVITSLLHEADEEEYSMKGALERVEVPDCLFFLGVLFAVGGLEKVGLLKEFATQLNALVSSDVIIATLLGIASAIVDNVPLVAASQGMYDLSTTPPNAPLWNLICYCAATGGSLLVIGSAAGVAFLGLEKGASFGWYVKEITPGALVGYFLGIAGCVAQQELGLTIK